MKTASVDDCNIFLEEWSFVFNKLFYHNNSPLRKLLFVAHGQFGSKIRKHFLKSNLFSSVLVTWVLGINDPHANIAKEALDALVLVIPEKKSLEVWNFYCSHLVCKLIDFYSTIENRDEIIRERLYSSFFSSLLFLLNQINDKSALDIHEKIQKVKMSFD